MKVESQTVCTLFVHLVPDVILFSGIRLKTQEKKFHHEMNCFLCLIQWKTAKRISLVRLLLLLLFSFGGIKVAHSAC
jgi:hypothetical protein